MSSLQAQMSYASVAALGAPPLAAQPRPDLSLLEGQPSTAQSVEPYSSSTEVGQKRNRGDRLNELNPSTKNAEEDDEESSSLTRTHKKQRSASKTEGANKPSQARGSGAKSFIFNSHFLGLVNVLALGGAGYLAVKNWDRARWDRRVVSGIAIGLGTLLGSQGYLSFGSHQSK